MGVEDFYIAFTGGRCQTEHCINAGNKIGDKIKES